MIYLALSVLVYSLVIYLKTPKHRKVLAQLSVGGLTQREENEAVQFTASLFEDESLEQHTAKLDHLFKVKAHRIAQNNHEMLEYQEQLKNGRKEELEEQLKAGGGKLKPVT